MLPSSQKVGRYQILSLLGTGGHGEVWLAWDTQLEREVALKLLSSKVERHPNYRRRLEREARLSSALNHPNIVTVYDVGQADGRTFIAQEFVRGETLRQRLTTGGLPLTRAVAICTQVVAALEAVHAAGLVHRDIKPENIMLRQDGLVKVLDFGLARSVDAPAAGHAELTRPGAVIGTLKYISPEQARGLEVDARSDIFSLGVMLYEMLAGVQPFEGPTEADVIAAILKTDPEPLSRRSPTTPSQLDRMVSLCLQKDRDKRYQTAGELRRELESVARMLEPPTDRPRRNFLLALAALMILLGIGIGYAIRKSPGRPASPSPFNSMRISRLATPGEVADAAMSPDGKLLAYSLDQGQIQSLWLRKLGTTNDTRIASAQSGSFSSLTFSSAGTLLYYLRQDNNGMSQLYRMPVAGGEARRIGSVSSGSVAFSRDGSQYAFVKLDSARWESSLVVGQADGSATRVVSTRKRPDYLSPAGLAWSPDGRSIGCFAGNATYYTSRAFQLVELDLDGKLKKVITPHTWAWVSSVLWSADGQTLIVAAGDKVDGALQIWLVSYLDGAVRRLTNDLSSYTKLSLTADSNSLLAVRTENSQRLWITRPGAISHITPIPVGVLHSLNSADWTPQGGIVFSAAVGDDRNIWIMDADGGNLKQLTNGSDDKSEVNVTRDGRYILYRSQGRIWRVRLDGSDPRQLTHGSLDVHPCSSADGQWVLYASFADWSPVIGGKPTLWRVSIDGGQPVQLSSEAASLPRPSPDGKLLAFLKYSGDDPRFSSASIAIMPFAAGQPARPFASPPFAGNYLAWAPDGKAIDYAVTAAGVGNLWRQPVRGGPAERLTDFETGLLFQFAWSGPRKQILFARGETHKDIVLLNSFN
jgi:serine/threonine protein kinase